jgi:hypothetical protein
MRRILGARNFAFAVIRSTRDWEPTNSPSIHTWQVCRRYLGRNYFRLIRTASGSRSHWRYSDRLGMDHRYIRNHSGHWRAISEVGHLRAILVENIVYIYFCYTAIHLAKVWYRRLNRPHGRSLTFITMLSILYYFSIQLHLSINLHLKQSQFISKWIKALGVNSNIIAAPINVLLAFSLTILIDFRVRWFWKATLIAGLTEMDLLLYMLKVSQPKSCLSSNII